MIVDLGTVKPGSTIRIPFNSFDKDDGSSITMTNYAAADILVYKDGGTTERASTAGYTATTDFDGKTGKHLAIIDLADNTTAGFWNAGSEYLVALDSVTVDAVTVGGWIARFRIGYPGAILDTTLASLSSQTSFTLTAGPAEDDALNGCVVRIHDLASAVQSGFGVIADYTGSTKTVTLTAGVSFTAASGDNISIFPPVNVEYFHALAVTKVPLAPATAGRDALVAADGSVSPNWADVKSPTTVVGLSGTTVKTATDVETDTADIQTRLPAALTAGGNMKADALALSGDTTAADNLEAALDGTGGVTITAALTGNVTGNLSGSVGSVTGAVGSVTGAVGSVGAGGIAAATFAAGAIDAAAIAADAIGASELAAGAVDEILDDTIGDGTITVRQALRILIAGMAGKLSGAATTTVTIRNLADSADVVVATVDADGNRSAVTVTP
jgi:hypothetical protein